LVQNINKPLLLATATTSQTYLANKCANGSKSVLCLS